MLNAMATSQRREELGENFFFIRLGGYTPQFIINIDKEDNDRLSTQIYKHTDKINFRIYLIKSELSNCKILISNN